MRSKSITTTNARRCSPPSRSLLEAADVPCKFHSPTGPIAETIVERATRAGSNMIYMGTPGMSALPNMAQ